MRIEFKLNYVNTASSKQIADILIRLEDFQDKCKVKGDGENRKGLH